MKFMYRILLFIGFSVILVQLVSCKKILDKIIKDPLAVKKGCNIKKIIQEESPGQFRTHVFSYNAAGNPVSVINDDSYEGAPQLYFRYDAHKKLTDYIGLDEEGSDLCIFWYKYVYNLHDRVIRDTQWVFGDFGDQPDPDSWFINVRNYSYDAAGRIASLTRTQIHPVLEAPTVTNFTYDAAGNLVSGGGAYDEGLNFRRTNKLWMFLDANYSLNNKPAADTYNLNALPLEFNSPTAFAFLAFGGLGTSIFEYECP